MGGRRDHKKIIINATVLETGYSKKIVGDVVNSFLGIYQDLVSDGGRVYINGFGEMMITKRRFWDINYSRVGESGYRVKFKATKSFLNLVRHAQEIKETEKEQQSS